MKKILLLSTGGTIASVASDSGLVPRESGEGLIQMLGQLPYEIEVRDILQLDSSNIQPEEWEFIAKKFMSTETIMTELSFRMGPIQWPIRRQCSHLCCRELTCQ